MMSDDGQNLFWQITVPIFRNSIILKQLGLALGIPFGLLAMILLLTSGKSIYTLYALGLIAALLFLTWLFMMVFYRGNYEAEFFLDEKGVLCRTQAGQQKKNRLVNFMALVMGLFSGKPTVAGAGLLAQSRQEVFLGWKQIRKVTYKPGSLSILMRGGWTESIAIFCTKENYPAVEQYVKSKTGTKQQS